MAVTRTGYIGLGTMGLPMATNVVRAGYNLLVYDVREDPLRRLEEMGAKRARSAAEVGQQSEVVELSVVDDAQVEDVVLGPGGLLETAQPGTIVAIHSTIHPRTAQHVAEVAQARDVLVLDAQVSGGKSGATAAQLCYMVGGDPAAFERARPVFETSGRHIFYTGAVGTGAATKLAQQVIVCLNRLSAREGLGLAEAYGLDLQTVQDVVHVTSAQSRVADNWLQDYKELDTPDEESARWMAHLFWKGLIPALELGHELGQAMPATALVQQLFPKVLGLE